MKTRLLASFLAVALIQCGVAVVSSASDTTAGSAAASVSVTAIRRTAARIGSVSLPVSEGSKLEVLGRESDSLVVKFRSSKAKVPIRDTDFNPATMSVPEIAPEPAAAKSTDLTINAPAPAQDSTKQIQASVAASSRVVAAGPAPQKAPKPAKQSAPPPPVNN